MTQPEAFSEEVKGPQDLAQMPEEYRVFVQKIITHHAINELYGAQVFDEPAINMAPTPVDKWLACRLAMEEYGHHVRFARLASAMGVEESRLDPNTNRHLDMFDVPVRDWVDFVVMKAIGDLAEIIQVEDLVKCTYVPLRELCQKTIMHEELFHTGFGRDRAKEMVQTPEGAAKLQESIDRIFPLLLPFFGGAKSKNNEIYRRWGIKMHTNDEMRLEYIKRVRKLVEEELGLKLPPLPEQYAHLEPLIN